MDAHYSMHNYFTSEHRRSANYAGNNVQCNLRHEKKHQNLVKLFNSYYTLYLQCTCLCILKESKIRTHAYFKCMRFPSVSKMKRIVEKITETDESVFDKKPKNFNSNHRRFISAAQELRKTNTMCFKISFVILWLEKGGGE